MNKKLFAIALVVLTLFGFASPYLFAIFGVNIPYVGIAFAQDNTTSDITNVVLTWMPLIILFAILGMILGMLKKLGKW
jgi:hypothetical protein